MSLKEAALSDNHATSDLQVVTEDEHHEGRHTLREDSAAEESISIEMRRGDDLVANGVPAPDVVKIDIEDAEGRALRGLTETLSRDDCRYVQCEVHPQHGVEITDVTRD